MTAASVSPTSGEAISADPAANLADRVEDLLGGRLSLEDKAGLMFQAMLPVETEYIPDHDGEPLRPGLMQLDQPHRFADPIFNFGSGLDYSGSVDPA